MLRPYHPMALPLRTLVLVLGLVVAVLGTSSAPALGQTAAISSDGTLYQVRRGKYRDLFPELEHSVPGRFRVLALDVVSGEQRVRWLVPGSEDEDPETTPAVVVEPDSGAAYLLWASEDEWGNGAFHLVGFDGEQWGEPFEVSGNTGAVKGAPQLAVTRDEYSEGTVRTVVHLLWWEKTAEQDEEVFYSPIVLLGGEYLGWNPVLLLDAMADESATPSGDQLGLFRAPSLESGTDGRTVVVGLPERTASQLLTMRIRVLPRVLLDLADEARSHITVVGARTTEGTILSLAEQARSHVTVVGLRLHEGLIDYIASRVYMKILAFGATYTSEDIGEIGQRVHDEVIAAGASILGNELSDEELPCRIFDLGASPEQAEPEHQVELCVVTRRNVPETGGPVRLYVSEDATRTLVTWRTDNGELHYRQSEGDTWSEESVAPTEDGDIERALEILRAVIRPE